jgi:AraC-like DNA-binding protein
MESLEDLKPLQEKVNRQELLLRIARAMPQEGRVEPIRGLFLNRAPSLTGPIHGVTHPSFCVIAQGAKEIHIGEERYRYDPYHYLLATIAMPAVSQVVGVSPEKPYLSLRLDLDPALVASVMIESGLPASRKESASVRALDVSPLDARLLEDTLRLVRLVDAPDAEVRVLLPLISREIVYRLLAGVQGERLRHIAALGGTAERIARAVERLRRDYDKPLRIASLAHEAGMSTSGFHGHFKSVTAMSPLQFQKQLRLQEARRLLLSQDMDAAGAGYRVGYEDAAQFNREYKRLFGEPPMRDVERLRSAATVVTSG